jgi:beta-phosphoglucomutase family hydrolase
MVVLKLRNKEDIMIKAILFDMDGVLINTMPMAFNAFREVLEGIGADVPMERIRQCGGVPTRVFFGNLMDEYNFQADVDQLTKELEKHYFEYINNSEALALIDDVEESMKWLDSRGYKIAVASSSPTAAIEKVIHSMDIAKYVRAYVGIDQVKRGKPHPDIFLLAADKLKVKPEECIVVEDALSGVTAANAAGMTSVAFLENGNNPITGHDSDYSIDFHHEVRAIIIDANQQLDYLEPDPQINFN